MLCCYIVVLLYIVMLSNIVMLLYCHFIILTCCYIVMLLLGGPELKFSSSVTFFPIFGLTAVLKILSFRALALGDNIADL